MGLVRVVLCALTPYFLCTSAGDFYGNEFLARGGGCNWIFR